MVNGYIDIRYDQARRFVAEAETKQGTCRVLPAGRFYLNENGSVTFWALVCKDIGGESTGVGASGCRNCVIKAQEQTKFEAAPKPRAKKRKGK